MAANQFRGVHQPTGAQAQQGLYLRHLHGPGGRGGGDRNGAPEVQVTPPKRATPADRFGD